MKTQTVALLAVTVGAAILAAGCERADEPQATPQSSQSLASAGPHLAAIGATFSDLPVAPKPEVTPEFIAHGQSVYQQNCAACHGANGDGKGDAAAFLLPRPRNFVEANYRIRSTPSGELPTDVDLYRAVSLGMPGTPMPPWEVMLSENDRWAVVEYMKTFSPRFASNREVRPAVINLGTPPPRNAVALAEGKTLYATLACVTCHGESGRGDGPSAVSLTDDSQLRIKPRDLTRPAAFKSGYSTKEIVRTILTGFNGTPMAGYHGAISETDAWKVAYHVESMARPAASTVITRASQNFLERETLGRPDVRIKLTERAWKYDPEIIRVKQNQIVEITFEPTDNGLGVGHGFAISSYDEVAFLNGAMVGVPKTVKFRADRAGRFTYYCSTQCSTEKLHPLMNGTLIVEAPFQTASAQ